MKAALFLSTLAAGVFAVSTALFAQTSAGPPYRHLTGTSDWLNRSQYPLQSSLGYRTAQPQCGFAATQDWGPNGFQWCDSQNMYPKQQIYPSNASGLFIASDRAGSASTRSGRRGTSKFKFRADTLSLDVPAASSRAGR